MNGIKIKDITGGKNGSIFAGEYNSLTKTLILNNNYINTEIGRNTVLHELQHRIQPIKGLENGDIGINLIRYYTNLGEIQARDVEQRSRSTYRQLQEIAPESSKKIPIHQLLKIINENQNSNFEKNVER